MNFNDRVYFWSALFENKQASWNDTQLISRIGIARKATATELVARNLLPKNTKLKQLEMISQKPVRDKQLLIVSLVVSWSFSRLRNKLKTTTWLLCHAQENQLRQCSDAITAAGSNYIWQWQFSNKNLGRNTSVLRSWDNIDRKKNFWLVKFKKNFS